jgi:hypothetical protein
VLLLDDAHGIGLRFTVWWQRTRLDAELAAGLDPAGDELLEARAEQLTSAASRRALARTLRQVLDAAEEPPAGWGSARPPLQREAVLAAREDLAALADRLSDPRDVPPQGVACAAALVWDSASPIYAVYENGSLPELAHDMLEALDGAE